MLHGWTEAKKVEPAQRLDELWIQASGNLSKCRTYGEYTQYLLALVYEMSWRNQLAWLLVSTYEFWSCSISTYVIFAAKKTSTGLPIVQVS